MQEIEPVIHITKACNHRCLFCSRKKEDPPESPKEISEILKTFKYTVTIEGGEPTLSKELFSLIRKAKKEKVREVMLVTNGFSLDKQENVRKMMYAGVDIFNFNFPSHIERIYNLLTGSKDFKKTVLAIKNCIEIAGPQKTRLTMVLNSVNYKHLYAWCRFIKKEFKEIFYCEVNMIKVLGSVRKRTWLVPKLTDMEEYLYKGFDEFKKLDIKFISDGLPLCFMKGSEENNIDAAMADSGGLFSASEKAHVAQCRKCLLKKICPGPRKDYVLIYGCHEIKPCIDASYAMHVKSKLRKRCH